LIESLMTKYLSTRVSLEIYELFTNGDLFEWTCHIVLIYIV